MERFSHPVSSRRDLFGFLDVGFLVLDDVSRLDGRSTDTPDGDRREVDVLLAGLQSHWLVLLISELIVFQGMNPVYLLLEGDSDP